MAGYLPMGRGGAVNDPGVWQAPAPAGGAPVRQVAAQPVTLPRQTKLTTATFPMSSMFRSPTEMAAFTAAQAGPIGSDALTPQERALLDRQIAESKALQQSVMNPQPTKLAQLFVPPLPQRRPPQAPTAMDIAASNAPAPNADLDQLMAYTLEKAKDPMFSGVAQSAVPIGAAPPVASAQGSLSSMFNPKQPTGIKPSTTYDLKNIFAQAEAKAKAAKATGQTGTTIYKNGQKVGNVGGGTSAQAYDTAAARSVDRGSGGSGGNPTWW